MSRNHLFTKTLKNMKLVVHVVYAVGIGLDNKSARLLAPN